MNTKFPLSINQKEIYIDQMMWTEGSHLNIGAIVTVQGAFDIEIFNYAINKVIRCYPGLRTRIYDYVGKPLQTIAPHQDEKVTLVDFSSYEDREERAQEYIKSEFATPFNFGENAPLTAFKLIRVTLEKHIIFAKYHHTITDGWGTAIFFREVIGTYNQIIKNGADTQIERNLALIDYLQDESAYLESRNFESDRSYWTKRLTFVSTKLFPLIKPQQLLGNRKAIYISRDKYNRVNALCQEVQSNAFHFILSIIIIYLAKRYNKSDLVIGLSLLNRNKKSYKDEIGLFVSTIPFRVEITGNETVQELLDKIRSLLRQDYRHQRFPLAELKRISGLQAGSKEHLFEVYLSYEKHDYNECFADTKTNCVPLYSGQQKIPLIVYVREYEAQSDIKIDFDYNLSYFDFETVEEIVTNFQKLFDEASEMETTISSLSLLSARESERIIEKASITTANETLISAFEINARKYSENLAVQFKNITLTYAELQAKANRLAHYLLKQGVKPGTRVGMCLERSENTVVTILGILKAGAAYVPLDPNYPSERIELILQDSGISVLIAEKSVLSQLTSQVAAFTLESIESELAKQPDTSLEVFVNPEFPAYIIYTSGSTGTPKGCIVTHANVIRLMRSTEAWFNFNEKDIWTLFHSFAFDFSVWELWGAIFYGGKVIIVPFWLSRSPEAFREFLTTEKVTVLNQTPSAFYQLIRADEPSVGKLSLRYVIFGGEALDLQSLRFWLEKYGDKTPRLINMYGITETTVHVTYRPISLSDLAANASVIGTTIPDLTIYLLDEKLELVPDGLPGEIYVAGAGVTHGYLNRPALTAERFVPNPFDSGRLYRSGDLGRRLPNGDLEYLGRVDRQVKIRGFRMELGEIQTALTSHSQVREAMIVTDEWEEEKRLIAYYVPGESNPTANELRQHLKTKLPDYMIPSAYVSLDAFPLTVHGKIDVRLLPTADWNLLRVEEEYVAPRNRDEESLCAIVADVLGLERVGIDDNFFDIGGDSILALQVIAKAKKAGFAISGRELYEFATVRQLATKKAAISEVLLSNVNLLSESDRLRLPKDAENAYPLSSLQAGMLYHSQMHPDSAIFHQIFTFDLRLPYSEESWKKAIADICLAHPVLRTSFHWTGYSTPIQIVHREVELPLTICDLRQVETQNFASVQEWIKSEKTKSFNVSQAPLFRFQIHRLEEFHLSFSFSFHHVILDGWSVATLLTQLLQRYIYNIEAKSILPLTVPAIPYSDFIAQEQSAIANQQMREFWQKHLSNLEVSILPRLRCVETQNFASVQNNSKRQLQRHGIAINEQIANSIRKLTKSAGVPLKTALLAVHLRVLAFLTGQNEVVTGNVINARPEIEDSQNLLGLFVNTVPFRIELTSDSWLDFIQAVFRAEREIIPFRNFPLFEMQRLTEKRTLFDVAFNYVHFHVYEGLLNLPQVEVLNVDIFEETDFSFLVEFCLMPGSSALQLNLVYDVQQFDEAQVDQYGKYYQTALRELATNPELLARRSLISPEERQSLLQADNHKTSYVSDETLVSAFTAAAKQHASHTAVTFEETNLTFAELEIRSNRLAHYLKSKGVCPEMLVGLCLERSEQLAIAILAILKAGGAYVPIDTSYPSSRIDYLLQDSGISVLVTQRSVVSQISAGESAEIVVLEDIAVQLENQSSESVAVKILPDHPAYVIYTSGSTGKPKGCIVTHANVIRLLKATEPWFKFNSDDVWTLFHSYAFDFSVWELWGALLYGGKVVVVPHWTTRSPKDFFQLLESEKVTVLNQTPSAFKQLIQASTKNADLALRYIIFGGEALELQSLQPWFELYGDEKPRLINMYGITETTVHVTYREITQADAIANQGSVIGQPIPDLSFYILDENLEPSPIGVAGEVYIAGAGVTRGYLHHPRLSAERFIPNPFAFVPGSRLYRTGDLARRLPNGELEYLGRADQQIKIRGFRIEPGEIAAVLSTHPQIKEAFVTVRTGANADNRIVAYFVSDAEDDLKTVLRSFLTSKLPDYMIPTAFMPVEAIPLTVNGKIDQTALPAPDWGQTSKPYIAPRNDQEATICSLMASLLKLERVGITDDFFEIGGNSLLVTQLVIRLRETYKTELPLPQFFSHRTPEQLAHLLSASPSLQSTADIPKAGRKRRSVNLSDDGLLVSTSTEDSLKNLQN
ncbi:amino acid adenylation domain-containing protein [Tolypothrix sp. NIES-4075]|uniref:non-ribosomal peptide synthetase n=1 Tax=Tolypothrix sp. NIES-4075 TaxID=2005459 RepID=UPI000B5D03DD|nr:non-ribosomal peptide synthetase [Tolypothrix sp. NIES-4075]GAX43747.1 amino acid adenylation domain-containing protein [Tolypothrix sp. NIES-4075]